MTLPADGPGRLPGISIDNRFAGLSAEATNGLRQSALALDRRAFEDAERALTPVLSSAPGHPEVLRLAGLIAHRRGAVPQSIGLLRNALSARPNDPLTENALGSALSDSGDIEGAIEYFERACDHAPGFAPAFFNLGQALLSAARVEEARTAVMRGLEIEPGRASARVLLAHSLKASGDVAAAADEYRRAIASDPRHVHAWAGLADLKTVPLTAEEIRALKQQLSTARWSDEERAVATFALAKALDDGGRHAEAFAAWSTANELRRRQFGWNSGAFSRHVDAIIDAFPAPSADTSIKQGDEIVFIVGLPRSGSTLVEQILSSHSEVEGPGELLDLPTLIGEESQRRGKEFPQWVADATAEEWAALGRRYLERTARWRQRRPRSTDKLPDNWVLIGAALAMLPGARIVNCRRDPVETCWSCFRQLFARGRERYAYGFIDLASYWHDYDRLMRHWHALHSTHVHDVNYEALVEDPDKEIRTLLAFCDLSFESSCVEFHTNPRNVGTASAAQVREPLRGDTAQAPRYGALLEPLRRALATRS
ncbi:MAG TPA: sulfotransferase [Rhodanobacteraceae bacterium]|nr:sulfotransferase [Rhodanobacteraceae bacterium]